jgi:hypothetical protein
MVIRELVCLANSKKLSGRCVAGITTDAGPTWVRPVSTREGHELSEYDRQFENGQDPKVLDIIQIPLKGFSPSSCQTENWVIDDQYYWVHLGRMTWTRARTLADHPASLWTNGYSTFHGSNDQIPDEEAAQLDSSLALIALPKLTLRTFAPSQTFGSSKRKVQAQFVYRGVDYAFWVTDPTIERAYLALPDGEHQIRECLMTVSIGESFKGARYKLAAAIILPP